MKKIVSLIIAAALVLSLACLVACGGKEAEDDKNKISNALTTTAPLTMDDANDDLTDESTDDSEANTDESMTGNVDDDNNGVIESKDNESTSDDKATTLAR
ncbi:MAG: hypothetical protein NC110_01010 [Ruminococcus sp.]|nr:hypothetical protein [Ruminococcus sp.]